MAYNLGEDSDEESDGVALDDGGSVLITSAVKSHHADLTLVMHAAQ